MRDDVDMLDAGAPKQLNRQLACFLANGDVRAELLHDLVRNTRGVNGGRNSLALETGDDILGNLRRGANLRLFGRSAEMRGDDSIGELVNRRVAHGLALPHVNSSCGDVAALESVGKSVHVDKPTASDVENDCTFGHRGELSRPDHSRRLLSLGHVQGDEIGAAADFVHVINQLNIVMCRALGRAVWIVADELHTESCGTLCDEQAHMTGTEDAERFALQLTTCELRAVPLAFLHGRGSRGGVTRCGEHESHGLFCSGDHVGKRRVADDDAALSCGLTVDVVDADTRTADHLELSACFDNLARDCRRTAHDQALVIADNRYELLWGCLGFEIDPIARLLEHLYACG